MLARLVPAITVAIVAAAPAPPAAAEPVRDRFVEAELVSEAKTIKAGQPFWAGLRLVMDPEWHTYWENPGDSGLPTTLRWTLPEGFSAGELHWPYPQRFVREPYVSYGYEHEVLLIAEVTPPASLPAGQTVNLQARADWTVCREDLCVPGGADLMLDVQAAADEPESDGYWKAFFDKTRARLPRSSEEWKVTASPARKAIKLKLSSAAQVDPGSVIVMERERGLVDHRSRATVERDGNGLAITLPLAAKTEPKRFSAIVVAEHAWDSAGEIKALEVSVPVAAR